jgi:hypothetical protein
MVVGGVDAIGSGEVVHACAALSKAVFFFLARPGAYRAMVAEGVQSEISGFHEVWDGW